MRLWRAFQRRTEPEPETRSGVGYTASLTAALEAGATGAIGDSAPIATAAVEAAAGLYARSLAAAVVKDAGPAERALSPAVLATIARNMIRRGGRPSSNLCPGRPRSPCADRLRACPRQFPRPAFVDVQRNHVRADRFKPRMDPRAGNPSLPVCDRFVPAVVGSPAVVLGIHHERRVGESGRVDPGQGEVSPRGIAFRSGSSPNGRG